MTGNEQEFAPVHAADLQHTDLDALRAESLQQLQAVNQRYSGIATKLRLQIAGGAITSGEAVSLLCSNYNLTRLGAEDILRRF